ncbi:SpaH/EbpB family LPXTG-anchored major pilin [Bifidobacterium pullorum]|uniref:SpaH/EbpB family LPXTG-anchored major pilin n=1 Tax=Bifidobacterium pullorum TaxID=78448 RepID=UPI00307C807C
MLKGMLKRALGVVAAAAMAVTGAVALSGTANAAPAENKSITIEAGERGVVDGHSFKYVQVGVFPNENVNQLVTVSDETVRAAVKQAIEDATGDQVDPAGMDPLVWAQGRNEGEEKLDDSSDFPWLASSTSRKFADNLKTQLDTGEHVGLWTPAVDTDSEPDVFTIGGLQAGLYLVVDTTTGEVAGGLSLPMLVSTGNTAMHNDDKGKVVVKNQDTSTPPTKNVAGDHEGTVTVGSTLDFSIEGSVPSTSGKGGDYTYVFKDYASTNLQIDLTSIEVYVGDSETPLDNAANAYYTVNPTGDTAMGNGTYENEKTPTTFTVAFTKSALDKLQQQAGQKLTVKYTATVTGEGGVDNDAVIDNGGKASGTGSSDTVTSTPFSFTKVGPGNEKLEGVSFTIAPNAGTPALPDGTTEGTVDYQETQTSDDQGVVSFAGLADGTYTVTEGTPKEGYMNTGLSFTVTIDHDADQPVTLGTESSNWLAEMGLGLVSQDTATGAITVKNVKNITQLPLTGAAGITMFIVLGLLIAGAGVTVYMKSRNVRRMMRA